MEESLLEIVPRLEKRTHYLSSLANIGMLIGLLGTIIALIHAFATVSQANPAEKAALLAAAISEAMNNTAAGLGVAITLLLAHMFLEAKTTSLIDSLEIAVVKFLNSITERYSEPAAPAPRPAHGAARPGTAACLIASHRYLANRQELTRWPRPNSPPARCAIMRSTADATTSTSCR